MTLTPNQVLWVILWFLSIQVWSSEFLQTTDQDKRLDANEYALKEIILVSEEIKVEINIVDDEDQPKESANQESIVLENQVINNSDELQLEIIETKNQDLNVPENQMIKNPNELPIQSSFQQNQWFQIFRCRVVKLINKKQFPIHIVNLIYSYVYEPFVPMTGNLCHHEGGLNENVLSRNGQWLLSIPNDSQQYLYLSDLSTGNKVRTFQTPSGSDLSSCAMADCRLFVVGGGVGDIYLWNTNSSDLLTILHGHERKVSCLCVIFNDTRIISGSWDCTIRMWSVEDTPGNCLLVLWGNTNEIGLVFSCFFAADTERILSTSLDRTLRVWDSRTAECIQSHPCDYYVTGSIIMSEDNQYVSAIIYGSRKIKAWNINNGECMKTIDNLGLKPNSIFYLSVDRLVFEYDYHFTTSEVYVWDLKTNECIYTLKFDDVSVTAYVQSYKGMVDRKYLIIISRFNKEIGFTTQSIDRGPPPQEPIDIFVNWIHHTKY